MGWNSLSLVYTIHCYCEMRKVHGAHDLLGGCLGLTCFAFIPQKPLKFQIKASLLEHP